MHTSRPDRYRWTAAKFAAGIATVGAVLCAAPVVVAAPPDPADRLKKVERERKASETKHSVLERKADGVAAEIGKLKVKLVRIAGETQRQEDAVSALETKIRELDQRISQSSSSLQQRREQMTAMLAALERLSRHPPVALAARPGHPVDTVRSAILMRSAIPALETRSKELTRDLEELSSLRETASLKRAELHRAGKTLQLKRDQLSLLIDKKARLERMAREQSWAAKARAAELAAQAKDLKDLLARLEAERTAALERQAALEREKREKARRKAKREKREAERLAAIREQEEREAAEREEAEREAAAQAAAKEEAEREATASSTVALTAPAERTDAVAAATDAAHGELTPAATPPSRLVALPARGRLVRKFGQRTSLGSSAKGLSIETRPTAQVTAPRAGDVVFAGPFRGYGLLVIIRHDDGHHALLSGMAQVHAAVGDRVLAGEPVGLMGSGTGVKPTLYLELRRKGQPVNPLPWLTASRSKVSG